MKRSPLWLVTVPVVLAGIESGHALGNLIAGAPDGELFASPASGRGCPSARRAHAGRPASRLGWRSASPGPAVGREPPPRRSRCSRPSGFVLLELVEAFSEPGRFRLGGPAFALGLLFQLPAGALGYAVAGALLRLSDEARTLLLGLPRAPLALTTVLLRLAPRDELHVTFRLTDNVRGRAPPVAA